MEEDVKRVKRILNENIDCIFEFDSGEEHICIRDVLEIMQEYEQENNELKQALLTHKNLYEEVCKKNKELEIEKQDKIDKLEATIENMKEDCILDIDNFKWQLRNDNLYSQELETFIENYMRYYNK